MCSRSPRSPRTRQGSPPYAPMSRDRHSAWRSLTPTRLRQYPAAAWKPSSSGGGPVAAGFGVAVDRPGQPADEVELVHVRRELRVLPAQAQREVRLGGIVEPDVGGAVDVAGQDGTLPGQIRTDQTRRDSLPHRRARCDRGQSLGLGHPRSLPLADSSAHFCFARLRRRRAPLARSTDCA